VTIWPCKCRICGKEFISATNPVAADCGSMNNTHLSARAKQRGKGEKGDKPKGKR
jgi:hypothetical protein